MPRGYDRALCIFPFDHRDSFQAGMFGWKSPLSDAQTAEIARARHVIYEGFTAALAAGVPKEKAGILVDEQFGPLSFVMRLHTASPRPARWRRAGRKSSISNMGRNSHATSKPLIRRSARRWYATTRRTTAI
jgi:hypothetical protein